MPLLTLKLNKTQITRLIHYVKFKSTNRKNIIYYNTQKKNKYKNYIQKLAQKCLFVRPIQISGRITIQIYDEKDFTFENEKKRQTENFVKAKFRKSRKPKDSPI